MKTPLKNLQSVILSDAWAMLKKYTYSYLLNNGQWQEQTREVYDRGDGVTILLFNPLQKKILLTKQFRLPVYLKDQVQTLMIETCAGKLEKNETPEDCIKKEVLEETGHAVHDLKKVFEIYMSPGSVTEKIYFYTGTYSDSSKLHEGGGNAQEEEEIETFEVNLEEALSMVQKGEINDAKTIILLQYATLHKVI